MNVAIKDQMSALNSYSPLYENNSLGEKVFETMFEKNSPKLILDFLDEKTTFQEDIKLFLNFPKIIFLKSLVKRLFKTIFL